jgi:hypothetical protein
MSTTLERPVSFGRSTHVRTYWLLHSEGFRVKGQVHGVVEAVEGDPAAARTLVVRRGLLGRRLFLPADAVERVVPAEELLIVDGVPHARHRGRRVVADVRPIAGRTRAVAAVAARVAGRWTAVAAVATGRAIVQAGRHAVALTRAARPHARRGAVATARFLAALWALLAVASQAAASRLAHALSRLAGWVVTRGTELTATLLTRLGRSVGPFDGPRRR